MRALLLALMVATAVPLAHSLTLKAATTSLTVRAGAFADEASFQRRLAVTWAQLPAGSRGAFLVQCVGPVTRATRAALDAAIGSPLGETLVGVGDDGSPAGYYLLFATKAQAINARAAASVASVWALPAELKVHEDTASAMGAGAAGKFEWGEAETLLVSLTPGSARDAAGARALAAKWQRALRANGVHGATVAADSAGLVSMTGLAAADGATAAAILSAQPEALVVEPKPRYQYFNKWAHAIVQNGAGDAAQRAKPGLWDLGLKGEDEIVGIADSGLDHKSCFFKDQGRAVNTHKNINEPADLDHRKVVSYFAFANAVAGPTRDHGTHVAGSVAGNSHTTSDDSADYNGVAPEAKISFFDIGGDGRGLSVPNSLEDTMFKHSYDQGARIHSDSWGVGCVTTPTNANFGSCATQYSENAKQIDSFMHKHDDYVVLIAAGNDGDVPIGNSQRQIDGYQTVGSPATSKNCISVGAGQNDGEAFADVAPANIQALASPQSLASFSSKGPVSDGRTKPDVVAPGQMIYSAGSGTGPSCTPVGMQGTSMATPVTAGLVALTRQWYRKGFYPSGTPSSYREMLPSGSLLKGTIIHMATPMTGKIGFVAEGDARGNVQDAPSVNTAKNANAAQGWGRVHADAALLRGNTDSALLVKDRQKVNDGTSMEWDLDILDSDAELKVTIVWTDPPAARNAAKALINDLDLELVSPGGTVTLPGADNNKDTINPVEQVVVAKPEVGVWKVKVTGTAVPEGPQKFSMLASGDFAREASLFPESFLFSSTPSTPMVLIVAAVALGFVAILVLRSQRPDTAQQVETTLQQSFTFADTAMSAGDFSIDMLQLRAICAATVVAEVVLLLLSLLDFRWSLGASVFRIAHVCAGLYWLGPNAVSINAAVAAGAAAPPEQFASTAARNTAVLGVMMFVSLLSDLSDYSDISGAQISGSWHGMTVLFDWLALFGLLAVGAGSAHGGGAKSAKAAGAQYEMPGARAPAPIRPVPPPAPPSAPANFQPQTMAPPPMPTRPPPLPPRRAPAANVTRI